MDEWYEESKTVKLPQVRCPKGHYLSWKLYDPISKVDHDGKLVYEQGTFCCKSCGRYYDARECPEKRER